MTATYEGDGNNAGSASSPALALAVGPAPTTTTLSQSVATVALGSESADTFVATVSEQEGNDLPTGVVRIDDASTSAPICSAVLVADPDGKAAAQCNPGDTQFPAGTSFTTVTATYEGDADNAGSASSPALALAVGPAPSVTTLSQSADTVAYGSESADTFVATVTGLPAQPAPTGSVTVVDTATMTAICAATLVPNADDTATAVCNPDETEFPSGTSLAAVTAVYDGDGNYSASSSQPPQIFVVTDPSSDGPDRRAAGRRGRRCRRRAVRRPASLGVPVVQGDQSPAVHIEDEAAHLQIGREKRAALDQGHVVAHGGQLIGCGQELPAVSGDAALGLDTGTDVGLGRLDHGAIGVLHHTDAVHAQEVDGQDQGPEGVRGHPGPGIADDLGVAGPQAEHGQGVDPRIDAGQDGQPFGRRPRHTGIVEFGSVPSVGVEQVVEDGPVLPAQSGGGGLDGQATPDPVGSTTALMLSRVARMPLALVRPRADPKSFQYRRIEALSARVNDSVTSVPSPLGSKR